MKMVGYVDAQDVPTGDAQDFQQDQTQRFTMHLNNTLAVRNMLPFPVVIQLCSSSHTPHRLPIPSLRCHPMGELLRPPRQGMVPSEVLPMERKGSRSPSFSGAGSKEEAAKSKQGVTCFSLDPARNSTSGGGCTPEMATELEGILQLTVAANSDARRAPGGGVAHYVLGIDQEIALPFAKRSLQVRILALPEGVEDFDASEGDGDGAASSSGDARPGPAVRLAASSEDAACVSNWQRVQLPPVSSRKPWYQPITLRRYSALSETGSFVNSVNSDGADSGLQPIQVSNSVAFRLTFLLFVLFIMVLFVFFWGGCCKHM
ncbi:unnamed protein product [Polarella glacialis]|uniref:Uncharacterized protein n=1 Tax=Polarella glacialis TaxID=89957 RepID=A0A813KIE0_POLGL|nr:unnamed protein product [Polarella glacialis]